MAEPHVVSALKVKRSELAGEIENRTRELQRLRAALEHFDAIQDTAVNIRNKVARGGFSAVFFVSVAPGDRLWHDTALMVAYRDLDVALDPSPFGVVSL